MLTPPSDKEERNRSFSTAKAKGLSWMPRLWAPIHLYSERSLLQIPFSLLLRTRDFCFLTVNVLQPNSCTTVLLYLMLFNFHTQTGLSLITAIVQKSVMMEKVKMKGKKQLPTGIVSNDITVIRSSHNCPAWL